MVGITLSLLQIKPEEFLQEGVPAFLF